MTQSFKSIHPFFCHVWRRQRRAGDVRLRGDVGHVSPATAQEHRERVLGCAAKQPHLPIVCGAKTSIICMQQKAGMWRRVPPTAVQRTHLPFDAFLVEQLEGGRLRRLHWQSFGSVERSASRHTFVARRVVRAIATRCGTRHASSHDASTDQGNECAMTPLPSRCWTAPWKP